MGESGYKFCTQCGAKMPEDTKFCTECGAKFDSVNGTEQPETVKVLPHDKMTNTAAGVNLHEKAVLGQERASADAIDRIIAKNTEYYNSEFAKINSGSKSKFNWASFLLNPYHAAYRNMFTEWLKYAGMFMFAVYIVLILGNIIYFASGNSAIYMASIVIAGIFGIIYIVRQLMFSFNFNGIYYDHLKKKLAVNDIRPDISVVRAVILVVILNIVTAVLATATALFFGLAFITSSYSEADEEYYLNDDYYGYDEEHTSEYDENIDIESEALESETIGVTDSALNNLPQIEIADIFVSSDEAVSWSMSYDGGTYYMIPVGDDGNTIFFNSDNELAGYAEVYYMDAESIEQTENGGLKVTGTMYTNTSEPVYNGVFSVTWDSMEMIDWPYVEAVNGTEMTDVSMTGEYGYYGFIDSNADGYNTEAGGIYDVSLEYIFPDSNSRYLTEADVAGMDAATIRLCINEIYARHGRAFQTEDLNAYFSSKSWYTPMYSADEFAAMEDAVFNEYEKANITFLGGVRDRLNG